MIKTMLKIYFIFSYYLFQIKSSTKCKYGNIELNVSEKFYNQEYECSICKCEISGKFECQNYTDCDQLDCKNKTSIDYSCCTKLKCHSKYIL